MKDFLLVGILEQFDDTLLALEKLLPTYFKGALQVAHSEGMFSLNPNVHHTQTD